MTSYELPYVGRYFLFASQVDAVSQFTDEAFIGQIQTYDKFVILESTPAIQGIYAGARETCRGTRASTTWQRPSPKPSFRKHEHLS